MVHKALGGFKKGVKYGIDWLPTNNGLNLLVGGTFTRASEGSYLIGAPTDGSTPFLAWAPDNERRIEDRGDGLGSMLLIEGARTNYLLQSRQQTNAAWIAGTATEVENAVNGPDATLLAESIVATSGQISNRQTPTVAAGRVCVSVWARAIAGTVNHQMLFLESGGLLSASVGVRSTTWSRAEVNVASTGTTAGLIPVDARDWSAVGGQAATAQSLYADLPQVEIGTFPSSPIRTTTAAVTRAVDVLSFPSGQYPVSFLTRGFRLTFVPDATNAEIVASGLNWSLAGFDTDLSFLAFVNLAGNLTAHLTGPGAATIVQPAITFSRGQAMTFEVRPLAGTLTISGATTGNGIHVGSGFAWTPGASDPLRIGFLINANRAYGRFGSKITAL